MRAEFCIFESNAPGLKANFYEPYVDMPTSEQLFSRDGRTGRCSYIMQIQVTDFASDTSPPSQAAQMHKTGSNDSNV